MPRLSLQEMKIRPIPSNHKETHLKTMLAQGVAEEDTFMWSLVDLLTLLLIFFIFLYSQSTRQILSEEHNKQPLTKTTSVLPVQLTSFSGQGPIIIEEGSVGFQSRHPLVSSHLPDAPEETPPLTPPVPSDIERAGEPEKIKHANDSIEQLRQAAAEAINESEDPACSIRWNQNRLVFVLGERVTFRVGQAKLLKNFEPTLTQIAGLIASKKEYKVMVSGHTDDTPIYTIEFPSNWELSAARAITVAKLLIKNGVDPRRVSIQGFAEYRPLHENSTPENKEANRRVEIALVKEENREEDSGFTF